MSGGTVCEHCRPDDGFCPDCTAEGKASEVARRLARYDRAMELLSDITSYEPLSDSDGGFINTWSDIEAFLAEEPKR